MAGYKQFSENSGFSQGSIQLDSFNYKETAGKEKTGKNSSFLFSDSNLKTGTGKGRWWRQAARRSHRGQSLVEFALALPFLIFLLLAMTELGFLIKGHLNVTFAVREGIRAATQAGDYPQDYTPNDTRVPAGYDGDSVLVANVNSSMQDELPNGYLLMTFRADSSDSGKYGLVKPSNSGARWGTFFLNQSVSGDEPRYRIPISNPWIPPGPYQRVFQPVTTTLTMNVTNPNTNKTVTIPYIRQGWIPGVMNNDIYTYTVTIPFSLPTNLPMQYISAQTDPFTQVLGVVPPPDNLGAASSNLVMVRRQTSACPLADPINPSGYYYNLSGSTINFSSTVARKFCGSNNPNDHINPATPGYTSPTNASSATDPVIVAWKNSFMADPWYSVWRTPGGFCDVRKPSTVNSDPFYFNLPSISPNWLGVRLDYYHHWLTGWFGIPTLGLTDRAVKIIEPVPRPTPDWKYC